MRGNTENRCIYLDDCISRETTYCVHFNVSSVGVVVFGFAINVIKEKSSKLNNNKKKGRHKNENDFTLENWLFYLNFNLHRNHFIPCI